MTQAPRKSHFFLNKTIFLKKREYSTNTNCILFFYSGYIHFTEMYDMLRNMDPPLGFGNKCPYRLAYKKLIRMNMPVDEKGQVNFTTTLFALIRENLSIKMRPAEEMDAADRELRETIKHIWPLQAKKMLDFVVPPPPIQGDKRMTTGKVYSGLLILENWKSTKFGKIQAPGVPVSPISKQSYFSLLFSFFI